MTFSEDKFSPFFLASLDGVYTISNNVYISDNTMTDGGTYQGSVAAKRNIVITAIANPKNMIYNQPDRDLLYLLFRKDEIGELVYTENDVSRKIEYVTESITRAPRGSRAFTISLLCPSPMFEDVNENSVSIANWLDGFEFIHEFDEDGEELGSQSGEHSVNIVNDVATSNIGITAIITATGSITNPSITRIESDESIKVGSIAHPFTMERGDVLTITTAVNNKHVRLTRNGVVTEVNEYLTEDSEFIQLMYGDNNIVCSADAGDSYMSVDIKYTFKYEAA